MRKRIDYSKINIYNGEDIITQVDLYKVTRKKKLEVITTLGKDNSIIAKSVRIV